MAVHRPYPVIKCAQKGTGHDFIFIFCISGRIQTLNPYNRDEITSTTFGKVLPLLSFSFVMVISKGQKTNNMQYYHSMAIAVLKKSEEIVKNTTAASKYILYTPY